MPKPQLPLHQPRHARRYVVGVVILLAIAIGCALVLFYRSGKPDVDSSLGLGKLSSNPVRRALLVGWEEPSHVNEGYFKDVLDIKDQISEALPWLPLYLRNYLQERHASNPQRIEDAVVLLQQVLDDPSKRPPRADLVYKRDSNGELSILKANREAFPAALESAFFALEHHWDPYELMLGLSQLDHPYIATHAGLWLFSTFHYEQAHHGLRFAMDERGLPNLWLIGRLDFAAFSDDKVLMARIIEVGDDSLFAAIMPTRMDVPISNPELVELVIRRVKATPEAVAGLGIDIDSAAAREALANMPEFTSLLRINNALLRIFLNSVSDHGVSGASIAEFYAARPEALWNLVAMHLSSRTRDRSHSREIALRLSENANADKAIRAEALSKLEAIDKWDAEDRLQERRNKLTAGSGEWTEVEPGVLVDTGSNRQWTRKDSQREMTRGDASGYCWNLSLGGGDWRVPDIKELHLILSLDSEASTPCGGDGNETVYCRVPAEFELSAHEVWSLEMSPNSERYSDVSVDLVDGVERDYLAYDEILATKHVLCVRYAPDEA